ncbi:unnamed protein product [Schistosoma margrebowiei]|uniref:Uncharacterized protein n=1 Tax=Schistosoma margrebowiei TaxID=48269 RepID=A0A183M913_9TREM|nr:unnamed protein product [Schistosoma margrebowiei]
MFISKVKIRRFVKTQGKIINILKETVLNNVENGQDSNVSMLDSDHSNDLTMLNEVLHRCENNVSTESYSDQIHDIILPDLFLMKLFTNTWEISRVHQILIKIQM